MCSSFSVCWDDGEVEKVMSLADGNGDGVIDYHEFLQVNMCLIITLILCVYSCS